MSASNLQTASGHLRDAWDVLIVRWADLREHWQDEKAREFEEQRLQPLAREMQHALPAIAHLSQVIATAERALTDEQRS